MAYTRRHGRRGRGYSTAMMMDTVNMVSVIEMLFTSHNKKYPNRDLIVWGQIRSIFLSRGLPMSSCDFVYLAYAIKKSKQLIKFPEQLF